MLQEVQCSVDLTELLWTLEIKIQIQNRVYSGEYNLSLMRVLTLPPLSCSSPVALIPTLLPGKKIWTQVRKGNEACSF